MEPENHRDVMGKRSSPGFNESHHSL